jgi:hypothetical protein
VEALEERAVPSFSPAVDYPVGLGPSAVVSGDFNADGRLDLAAANTGSNTVSVLLGNGNGTFQGARHFDSWREPTSLAVGDFNGDNHLDLVTSYSGDNAVNLLLGNGDGTFQAARRFAAGPSPLAVAAGDFNGDGRLDLAVGGLAVSVLLGNGDGTFQAAREVGSGATVAVGEVNGDGHLDLVTSYWVGDSEGGAYLIDVLLGNGDGTFSVSWNVGAGSSPVLGDLNGDGRLDLVAVYPPDMVDAGSVYVMLGNGDGTFQSNTLSALGASTCALADINGDGRLDIVTTNHVFNGGSVDVLLGDGAGHFPTFQTFPVSPAPTFAVVQDYNGDGFADVVAARSSADVVSVLINDGAWPPPPVPYVSINYQTVTVTEGNTGTRTAVFTVSLQHAYIEPVTVDYATSDVDATAGSDYQAASGTLTFAPGETRKTIAVLVNGDRLPEPTESFGVRLSNATNAIIDNSWGGGIILDDEPRISVSDVSMKEGKKNQTTLFTFTVTLSAAYDQPVTMSFRTVDGTAKASDQDYVAKTGTLTFAPGETTKTITIEVKGDSKREADETFYLDLFGNSGNSWFTKNRGIGTILNDD